MIKNSLIVWRKNLHYLRAVWAKSLPKADKARDHPCSTALGIVLLHWHREAKWMKVISKVSNLYPKNRRRPKLSIGYWTMEKRKNRGQHSCNNTSTPKNNSNQTYTKIRLIKSIQMDSQGAKLSHLMTLLKIHRGMWWQRPTPENHPVTRSPSVTKEKESWWKTKA